MHHGSDLEPTMQQEAARQKFGATGKFPEGQLNETDEGEITFGVAHDIASGKVMVNFGKPVAWLAMSKAQAFDLARALKKHAHDCRILGNPVETRHTATLAPRGGGEA